MGRSGAALLAVFSALSCSFGQGSAEKLPLEALRKKAHARVQEMKVEFEQTMQAALAVLKDVAPDADTALAQDARRELLPWATAFADQLVERFRKTTSANLRHQLGVVLVQAGSPGISSLLAELLAEEDPVLRAATLDVLGRLGDQSVADRIRALFDKKPVPEVQVAAVLALSKLKHPDAARLARGLLTSDQPMLRRRGVVALALAQDDPKADSDEILALAEKDPDMAVRGEALRALAHYPDHYHVLRLLHDTVSGTDAELVAACLDALEVVANKEVSRPYIQRVVQGPFQLALRERAARLLLQELKDQGGVKFLMKLNKEQADRSPKDRDLQKRVADEYYRLGAWQLAIPYYQRAVDTRSRSWGAYLGMARCYARLGRFDEAWARLKKADYDSLYAFRNDADFADMLANPKFAHLFKK